MHGQDTLHLLTKFMYIKTSTSHYVEVKKLLSDNRPMPRESRFGESVALIDLLL